MAIAIISAQIFEHVPHSEDEVAYIFQAKVFAQNRLTVPTPAFDDVFWSPFVVDYQGQRFGKYHPGWPLLLSLGVRLKASWLVNAVLGPATLALIAWLGHRFYCDDRRDSACYVGVLAAGLGLLTPGFLFLSSSLLSHSASLFWATLALVGTFLLSTNRDAWCVVRKEKRETGSYAHRKRPLYAALIGLALGAAFITRPFAALGIGVPIGIFLLVLIRRHELSWTDLLWLILGGLPVAALLPLYWWAISGDPTFSGYVLVWPYDRIGFGPDIGPQGYTLHDAITINTRLKLTVLATGLFGWPGWSNLLFLPIPFLAQKVRRWDWLLLGTLLGVITVHIFYWAFGGADGGFPRYYYDALPALLLLTARGLQISIEYLKQRQFALALPAGKFKLPSTTRYQNKIRQPVGSGRWSYLDKKKVRLHWLLMGLIVCFIGYNFIWNLPPLLAAQQGKYNITPTPLRVVAGANLAKPALIVVKDVNSWADFATSFVANSPTLDGPIVYAIDWGPGLTGQVRAHFPDRECWELRQDALQPCPAIESQ
jgi:hypothetical protein